MAQESKPTGAALDRPIACYTAKVLQMVVIALFIPVGIVSSVLRTP